MAMDRGTMHETKDEEARRLDPLVLLRQCAMQGRESGLQSAKLAGGCNIVRGALTMEGCILPATNGHRV